MRLFELLLFLSVIGLFAWTVLVKRERRKASLFAASGISALLLIIHWTVEGPRIQLLFPYCLTIIFLARSAANYFKKRDSKKSKKEPKKIPRFMLGSVYTATAIMLILTGGLLYAFPVFQLPEPTGPYKVGTQTFHFMDTNREEIFDKAEDGNRELMVQVWYPAQTGTGSPAPFVPAPRSLRYMAEAYGLPGFTFQHLQYISGHAYAGARASSAQASYPLILGNPGNGSSRFLHTSQAEYLASHGYMVAVIDHTYNTFATEFPDGRITTNMTDDLFAPDDDYRTSRESRDKLGKVLTDDITFVLDQFELLQSGRIPSALRGKIDLDHIGVFGHSIGGAAAYDASYDSRITAGINLDGGLYRLQNREKMQKPFLFITSESYFERLKRVIDKRDFTDTELERIGSTREWEDQVTEDKQLELERMRESIGTGGQVLYMTSTEHLNFTDIQFLSPVFNLLDLAGKIAPERANSIVNAYMLDFFDRHLKNQSGGLMEGPDGRFPEMKFAGPFL